MSLRVDATDPPPPPRRRSAQHIAFYRVALDSPDGETPLLLLGCSVTAAFC